ncbi:hypothetical protein JCM8097_008234 [Rhodosporidiobolus ruineniae]
MASIVVHPPPDSPRESTTYAPSEPLSTSPLHLAAPSSAAQEPNSTGADGDGGRGGTAGRPRSASAATMPATTLLNPDHPPALDFHFNLKGPLLYLVFLIICNVVIPVVIYYPLRAATNLTDKELIGIGSAALGVSSCFDAPFRMWKLTRHRAKYGPLYYPYAPDPAHEPAGKNRLMKQMPRSWWHLDFFMWTYQAGLFVFAVPLAIAPAIPLYNFFLFSFAMLVAPICIIFALTLKVWRNLPFWMSSDPPRTATKPAVYYFIEDVGAVDFRHGREWRKRCQARYAASPPFRALMWQQTLYWTVAMVIFIGLTAVVDWISSLNVAFGVVISLIFMWAIVFGIISYFMVHHGLKKELKWWRAEYASLVAEHHTAPSSPILAPSAPAPAVTSTTNGNGGEPGAGGTLMVPSSSEDGGASIRTTGSTSTSGQGQFLGEQGLSKPGKVAQGRHRAHSVHARLSVSAAGVPGAVVAPAPGGEMMQLPEGRVAVTDSAGRVVAVAEGGVPPAIIEGLERREEEKREKESDGSPV